jgi:hypothetical protein
MSITVCCKECETPFEFYFEQGDPSVGVGSGFEPEFDPDEPCKCGAPPPTIDDADKVSRWEDDSAAEDTAQLRLNSTRHETYDDRAERRWEEWRRR